VSPERHTLSRLTLPLRVLADRFAFGALVVLSLALLAVGKANVHLLDGVSTRIGDALVPALDALMQPVTASRRLVEGVGELLALRAENARLKEQNLRLLEWQSAARQLSVENAALHQLLKMRADPKLPTAVTGRVVADAGGPFVHTVLLDVGAEDGAARGMAAVNERGMIGRVIEVGRHSARVLLLTDFNSRIPVLVEPSRDQAILAGNNTRRPNLVFLPLNPRLSVGNRVLTSGRGGVLPPGLEIGTVIAIDVTGVTVEPSVDFARLEYLRLLEYGQIVPPEQLEEMQREMYGPPLPPEFVAPDTSYSRDASGNPADPAAAASGSEP
jgi:rod shape-determining protein MreC